MKTSALVAALAFMTLLPAPQARADDSKSFDVAAVTTRAERTAPSPGIVDAADVGANRRKAPIVIEILNVAYLADQAGGSAIGVAPPSKPAKRR